MSETDPVRVKDVMTDRYNLVDGLMMTDQALSKMRDSGSIVFHEEGLGATVSVFQRDDEPQQLHPPQPGADGIVLRGRRDREHADQRDRERRHDRRRALERNG